jgi:hypothetical protein
VAFSLYLLSGWPPAPLRFPPLGVCVFIFPPFCVDMTCFSLGFKEKEKDAFDQFNNSVHS